MSRKVKILLVAALSALVLASVVTSVSLRQNAPTAEQLAETTLEIKQGFLDPIDDDKVDYWLPDIGGDWMCFYLFEREVNLLGEAKLRFTLYEENWGEYAPGIDWSEPPTISGFTLKTLDEFMDKHVPGLKRACDLSLV